MSTLLERARFVGPLRGRDVTLSTPVGPLADAAPAEGSAWVFERLPASLRGSTQLACTRWLRFPGTGGGHVLLDASSPAVFRAGTRLLPRGRTWTRVASALVAASSRVHAHAHLAPGELVLVERADEPGTLARAATTHSDRFGGLPAGLRCNVASGVPGRDQKSIVQLVDAGGEVVAFAKIAHNDATRSLVRAEARVLERLAVLGIAAPSLVRFESAPHGTLLVQSALRGARSPDRLGAAHASYLASIERATRRDVRLCELPSHRAALERLERLAPRAEREWMASMNELARELERLAGSRSLPVALAHGDFTPWNLVVEHGRARAFDWEHARELAPAGDALHFVLQQAILVERVPAGRLWTHAERALAAAGPRPGLDALALGLYLLDQSTSDEERQLEQRSPFAQVDWLRAARLALVRELLQRMARDRGPARVCTLVEEHAA